MAAIRLTTWVTPTSSSKARFEAVTLSPTNTPSSSMSAHWPKLASSFAL